MEQKTETEQLQSKIFENLKQVRSQYQRHILNMVETTQGNVIMTLHTEVSEKYDGYQSRPTAKITLAVHEALKELDGDIHQVKYREATESDAVVVETRPFNRDEKEAEVL